MKFIANIAALLAAILFGYGAVRLVLVIMAPDPVETVAAVRLAPVPTPVASVAPDTVLTWPAVFGTAPVVEPQPPAPPTPPVEPQPPAPPIESLGYVLKGVIVNEGDRWAIVTHPTGDVILRVGDTLVEGVEVVDITEAGVALRRRDGITNLVFQEN